MPFPLLVAGGKSLEGGAGVPRPRPVLVSACLLGLRCRYDGSHSSHRKALELAKQGVAIPICPEQMGGLPTPRPKAWLLGGDGRDVLEGRAKVVNERGEEVTEKFLRGAEGALKLARIFGAERALLKSKSPSCGVLKVYVAKGEGEEPALRPGMGVASALLSKEGLELEEVG